MHIIKKWAIIAASMTIIAVILSWYFFAPFLQKTQMIGMAVEFNDHAACAWIADEEGWYSQEGLELKSMESYATGLTLSAALARGDIQVAYLCLGPAILAYSRGVPIKIVCGTHKYGYGIVAKSDIKDIADLEGKKVGCVREGSQCDILLQIVIKEHNLTGIDIRRMNPPKLVMALIAGEIDAAVLPEHYATVAESRGFQMIARSQDLWPNMLGSVMVVKDDLLAENPEVVKKLVKVTQAATIYINENPEKSAEILSKALKKADPQGVDPTVLGEQLKLTTPEILMASMRNLEYTNEVSAWEVQKYINILLELGYIEEDIEVEEFLDLQYLQ